MCAWLSRALSRALALLSASSDWPPPRVGSTGNCADEFAARATLIEWIERAVRGATGSVAAAIVTLGNAIMMYTCRHYVLVRSQPVSGTKDNIDVTTGLVPLLIDTVVERRDARDEGNPTNVLVRAIPHATNVLERFQSVSIQH